MPHIARIQSITNQPSGGGPKKAGTADHANWSRISYNIFTSKTPKLFLFSATTGNTN